MKQMLALLTVLIIINSCCNFSVSAQTKTTSSVITITNAYDAFGQEKKGLTQDFGFSCLINYKGKNILFDAGTNTDIFQKNLKTLKIDPKKIDIAILSHAHADHIGGFEYLISVNPKIKIYLPNDFALGAPIRFPFTEPEAEYGKDLPKDELYFRGEKGVKGMLTVPTSRFWKANVEFVSEVKEIFPGVTLVPTTSELMGTFIKYPPFNKNPQFTGLPEISASFLNENGQLIIAGCSHSTIETIIQAVKKIRKEKIIMVAGGFHLIPYDHKYIEDLAKRMKEEYGVEYVAPAHCTGQTAFRVFHEIFGDKYKFFGLGEKVTL